MKDKLLYIIIGVLLGVIGVQWDQLTQPVNARSDTVVAHKFVLVDPEGNMRREWAPKKRAGALFRMFDDKMKHYFILSADSNSVFCMMKTPTSELNARVGDDDARIIMINKHIDKAGNIDSSGQLYLRASAAVTQMAFSNPTNSSIEFIETTGKSKPDIKRLVLGNPVRPILLNRSLISRTMASIVVVGDSVTVTIP
jgi:hypothetical protein